MRGVRLSPELDQPVYPPGVTWPSTKQIEKAGLKDVLDASIGGQLILCGSRVVPGLAREDADWDLLIVSDNVEPEKTKGPVGLIEREGFDVMIARTEQICDPMWLGTELASHVAAWGVWLRGELYDNWRHRAYVSNASVDFKMRLVERKTMALVDGWRRLNEHFHAKRSLELRRQILRMGLLRQRSPVPPTPILDRMWVNEGEDGQTTILNVALSEVFMERNINQPVDLWVDRLLPHCHHPTPEAESQPPPDAPQEQTDG